MQGITISYDKAVQILNEQGGYGHTRVYATYKDGVFKGQTTGVKSVIMLDELTTAYNVELDARSTSISELITKA